MFDRTGPHPLVYPGVVLFAGGMLLLGAAHAPALFLVAGALLGLGFGALLPSFQTIAVQAAPLHRRGLATGTFYVLFDSGYGIGSSVLGVVAASRAGYHGMYGVAGLVVALSALLYYGLHHRPSRRRAAGRAGTEAEAGTC
jgi:MFS family permease